MIRCSWALLILALLSSLSLTAQELNWTEGRLLTVEGRAGNGERDCFYDRLPAASKAEARPELWTLAQNSAGLCIRFSTNSPSVHVRWKLRSSVSMPHLTGCVTNGIDFYAFNEQNKQWMWAGIIKPYKPQENSGCLIKELSPETRQYMLYLPMYNGVDSVFIGTEKGATLQPLLRTNSPRPIVFYGTSIMQGASASRAGLSSTAILGRFFNVETVNLGFSGNGRMEDVIGKVMASIDASCYVLDCLPNMTTDMLNERAIPFIQQLRAAQPHTPIVLVGTSRNEADWLNKVEHERLATKEKALVAIYNQLMADGFTKLYYISGDTLTGLDHEATIDGVHFNDLGYYRYVECLKPIISSILNGQ